jgi:hypothetical protein
LVVLLLEGASRRGSILRAGWAGAAFALIVLGTHPQLTFYAGLFVGLWTLGPALERAGYFSDGGTRSWRLTASALGQWALYGAVAATIAIALSAVQLMPTLEATNQTSRASAQMFSEGEPQTFMSFNLRFVGSALRWLVGPGDLEFGYETRGGLGLTWLIAAALAVVGGRGRVRFQAVVGLFLILFALGGWIAFQGLPGFRLYRLPSRMVLFAELPLALLAGTATDWLFVARERPAWLGRSAWAVGGVLALGALLFVAQIIHVGPRLYYPLAGVAAAVILVLLYRFSGAVTPAWKLVWGAVLLAEAWALARPLMAVRSEADLYAPSECAQYVAAHRQLRGRVLDQTLLGKADTAPVGYILPLLMNIESVRGYNPLDVHQYKQYLHFISDDDSEAIPTAMIGNIAVKNKGLLDLLGVRYLVQPASLPVETGVWQPVTTDAHPHAYCLFAGGVQQMPPYTVYENNEVFPRAFFVPAAAPMPGREQALQTLKSTDFRRKVLLEGLAPGEEAGSQNGAFRPATIRDYGPNRVTVAVESEVPGYLVLADVWFPGWTGTVNGQPATVYRANYLFRAMAVRAGLSEVVFTFDPASYRWGRLITTVTLAALALASVLAAVPALRRRASVQPAQSAIQGLTDVG